MAKQTYKYLIVVNLRGSLGGAEIRYLNLFGEISIRKNDYYLIINRKLFDIAVEVGYLNKSNNKLIILEIEMNLLKSTVFQFCAMVLVISAIAAANGELTWAGWLSEAVVMVGIYASKEGVKYGATAYKDRNVSQ